LTVKNDLQDWLYNYIDSTGITTFINHLKEWLLNNGFNQKVISSDISRLSLNFVTKVFYKGAMASISVEMNRPNFKETLNNHSFQVRQIKVTFDLYPSNDLNISSDTTFYSSINQDSSSYSTTFYLSPNQDFNSLFDDITNLITLTAKFGPSSKAVSQSRSLLNFSSI